MLLSFGIAISSITHAMQVDMHGASATTKHTALENRRKMLQGKVPAIKALLQSGRAGSQSTFSIATKICKRKFFSP